MPFRVEALTIATTTSLEDSGFLDHIIPPLEASTNIKVRVLVAGSGEALSLLKRGDVAAAIVHYPKAERAFVASHPNAKRSKLMHSRFVLVGPPQDSCGIAKTTNPVQAFKRLAECGERSSASSGARAGASVGARFVSRGDESGTHGKELQLWQAAGYDPTTTRSPTKWYISTGSGMGESLRVAMELQAYLLIDIATWLNLSTPRLKIVFDSPAEAMNNPYSVLTAPRNGAQVNGARGNGTRGNGTRGNPKQAGELAKFIHWLRHNSARHIQDFRLKGKAIFTP